MNSDDIKIYFNTWVETAAKGNVEVTYAWIAQRMNLECVVCKQTLTSPLPETPYEIDYSVQEFVKIHAHVGAHHSGCSCVACTSTTVFPTSPNCTHFSKGISAIVKHTTLDGHLLTKCALCGQTWTDFKPLPTQEGGQFQIVDYGKLKNSDKDVPLLKAQLAKFKDEYAGKLKALQQEELNPTQEKILAKLKALSVEKATSAKNLAEAAGSLMEYQQMMQNIAAGQLLGLLPQSPKPEETKKSPIKKDIRGRKFR